MTPPEGGIEGGIEGGKGPARETQPRGTPEQEVWPQEQSQRKVEENDREAFETLIEHINQVRSFDFTGYKRQSLMRRVRRRMQMVNIGTFDEYQDYLDTHPGEFASLFNTILINVTSFFRDNEAWDYLAAEIIPRIIASKEDDDPIRIWSAGCATGEEAYTIAMIMAEALGEEEFKRRVKIFATDADEAALAQARLGSYTPKDIELLPRELCDRYFNTSGGAYVFRPDLRRSVIFGRHDLVQDAPISHLDLLVCRNTLMYFNVETQGKVLSRFHFALENLGFIFLGRAELLLTHANLFTPLNLKSRVFMKLHSAQEKHQGVEEGTLQRKDRAERNRRLPETSCCNIFYR